MGGTAVGRRHLAPMRRHPSYHTESLKQRLGDVGDMEPQERDPSVVLGLGLRRGGSAGRGLCGEETLQAPERPFWSSRATSCSTMSSRTRGAPRLPRCLPHTPEITASQSVLPKPYFSSPRGTFPPKEEGAITPRRRGCWLVNTRPTAPPDSPSCPP